jgi:hypothetical protein
MNDFPQRFEQLIRGRVMTDDDRYEALAESYAGLAREARAVIASATLADDNRATVALPLLNRLARELKGEPQPSSAWMSPS